MKIENVVVFGAGTMGLGIAQTCAMSGLKVTLIDLKQEIINKALVTIKKNLEKGVARGKVSEETLTTTLQNLEISCSKDALKSADLFIEAIPENLQWKQDLFTEVDGLLPKHAMMASNTSSLSISKLAGATQRPELVIGLHFFNPVHIMKLLEIVKGEQTSAQTLKTALELGERLKKQCIVVKDSPGFATSRLGITLGNEAMRMFEEGVASAKDIDTAMSLGYGHPMGPLALTDLVGLDVRLNISTGLFKTIGTDVFKAPNILNNMVEAGFIGKKVSKGFYIWENGKIVSENPEAQKFLKN